MGSQVEKEPRKVIDCTKPWKRQFFECREIPKPTVDTQAGFWDKPVHGIPTKEKEGR